MSADKQPEGFPEVLQVMLEAVSQHAKASRDSGNPRRADSALAAKYLADAIDAFFRAALSASQIKSGDLVWPKVSS